MRGRVGSDRLGRCWARHRKNVPRPRPPKNSRAVLGCKSSQARGTGPTCRRSQRRPDHHHRPHGVAHGGAPSRSADAVATGSKATPRSSQTAAPLVNRLQTPRRARHRPTAGADRTPDRGRVLEGAARAVVVDAASDQRTPHRRHVAPPPQKDRTARGLEEPQVGQHQDQRPHECLSSTYSP